MERGEREGMAWVVAGESDGEGPGGELKHGSGSRSIYLFS